MACSGVSGLALCRTRDHRFDQNQDILLFTKSYRHGYMDRTTQHENGPEQDYDDEHDSIMTKRRRKRMMASAGMLMMMIGGYQ